MGKSRQPSICFLDAATVDLGDINLDSLKRAGRYRGFYSGSREAVLQKSGSAQILISNKFYLGKAEFQRHPELRLICIAATGTNNVDLQAAARRGIAVCNVAGYSTPTVVEHTWMFLLALGHRLLEHHRSVEQGDWSRSPSFALLDFPYCDLEGKTLGILGYGTIGKRVGRIARVFGMKVLAARLPGRGYPKSDRRPNLRTVLRRSDFVSLHCRLSPQTEQLINRNTLGWMKRGACLLNLSRGPVVDEAAVARALKSGSLAGYAADVLSREPPPKNHPLFAAAPRDKVLFTPHIAWASRESRQRLIDDIAKNIASFQRGKRRNRLI